MNKRPFAYYYSINDNQMFYSDLYFMPNMFYLYHSTKSVDRYSLYGIPTYYLL